MLSSANRMPLRQIALAGFKQTKNRIFWI